MPLFPPQDYRKTEFTHRIGLAADRPAAADVLIGTLYFSTDAFTLERSNGTTWDAYVGGGVTGPGSVTDDNIPAFDGTSGNLLKESTLFNIGDDLVLTTPASFFAAIRTNTSDGSDDEILQLCGGGAASHTRGAYINLCGNEQAGDVNIVAGNIATGDITFHTGTTADERLKIFNGGGISVGGAAEPAIDVLGVPIGIQFPATQVPSSDANTLDDYEEGTWTPTITAPAGTVTSYTDQTARYVKIGRLVFISGSIVINILGGTLAGAISLSGLPFTVENVTTYPATAINWYGLNTTWVFVHILAINNTTTMVIRGAAAAGVSSNNNLVATDITDGSGFTFSAFYRASA